jgi:hypothetical protein
VPFKAVLDGSVEAPRTNEARIRACVALLTADGLFPRRYASASDAGISVTYVHIAVADTGLAARVLAEGLDWSSTEVSEVPGVVAVTTTHD